MHQRIGTCAAALVLALAVSACSAGNDTKAAAGPAGVASTVSTLRALSGYIAVDEVDYGGIQAQSAKAEVIVIGPVVDVLDDGPADQAGSVTHIFRLTVQVTDSVKGAVGNRIDVVTLGAGDASEMRRALTKDKGLWILTKGGNGSLVPLQTKSVLFQDGDALVAPLAESDQPLDANSLDEAIRKSKAGAGRR